MWPSTFYASLYKFALKRQHLPFSKQLGDRRLSFPFFFMCLSECQMYFQDCPPARRQSKPLCPLTIWTFDIGVLIFSTSCFFIIRDMVYDHRILQGFRVNSRRFRESRWINHKKITNDEYIFNKGKSTIRKTKQTANRMTVSSFYEVGPAVWPR